MADEQDPNNQAQPPDDRGDDASRPADEAAPEQQPTVDAGEMAEGALRQAEDAVDELRQHTDSSEDTGAAHTGQGQAAEPSAATDSASADANTAEATGAGDDPAQADPLAQGANVDLPSFQQVMADVQASGIDLLHDVELNVKIELGRTHMLIEDVLKLAEGSVVELDKLAGDPVDVYVNDRLVARGEVLVLNDNFCVRINEIVSDSRNETPSSADRGRIASSANAGDDETAAAEEPAQQQAAQQTTGG